MEKSLKDMEDRELMILYQNDNHLAFEVLYNRHKAKIYSYLSKRIHNSNEVDDIYQRVLLKLHKSRNLYKPQFEVLPWLYTITKNELLDFFKKKNIQFESIDQNFSQQDIEAKKIFFDLDSEKQLSSKEKEAIELRYLKENDFSEISDVLKTSELNTRKIISRGLKKLRVKYQGRK